jgi:hypothetical protein
MRYFNYLCWLAVYAPDIKPQTWTQFYADEKKTRR